MTQSKQRMGRRLFGLAIAALLVWVVVSTVPWKDRLLVTFQQDQEAVELQGSLQGPWQADSVSFEILEIPESDLLTGRTLQSGQVLTATSSRLHSGTTEIEVHNVEWRPGLPRVFRELQWGALLPALLLLLASTLMIITRWYLLLRAADCVTRWVQVLKVTYVGLFFNLILPGMSGGDLARAYWMVKGHPERRAAAIMSVFMDRLLGLFALALLATVAIYTSDERFETLRLPVLAVTLSMLIGGLVLVNPWLRSLLPVGKILDRLPASERFHSLDKSLRHYGTRPGTLFVAILLSLANHLLTSTALYLLGHAMGDTHSFRDYVCIATVMNTLSAVPVSPGGLGVGEFLAGSLLKMAGGSYTIGVAASITYRFGLFALGLLGGLILILPGGAALREEWKRAGAEAQGDGEAAVPAGGGANGAATGESPGS